LFPHLVLISSQEGKERIKGRPTNLPYYIFNPRKITLLLEFGSLPAPYRTVTHICLFITTYLLILIFCTAEGAINIIMSFFTASSQLAGRIQNARARSER
jgi:hypothetical protein